MALRNQPYLPLYIQDFLTDEKLIVCSAEATGVYIRIMCIMHKSDEYGTFLLKQKEKQTVKQVNNFASKLTKFMPYSIEIIERALNELLSENVLFIDGDKLCQKRMVKDNHISDERAKAGSKGGLFTQAKLKAKLKANSENENVNVNEIVIKNTIDYNEIQKELLNSIPWKEQLSINEKTTPEFLDKKIVEFINKQRVDFPEGRTLDEVRRHFNNWIRIELTKLPSDQVIKVEVIRKHNSEREPLHDDDVKLLKKWGVKFKDQLTDEMIEVMKKHYPGSDKPDIKKIAKTFNQPSG